MFGTLSRSGSNSYSIGDERYYDAWGDVNTSYATGMPWQRYCANLGHVQDDESDLIYMRARYYEPSTGRFISEDPAMIGLNWYGYCKNDPIQYCDETGRSASAIVSALAFMGGMIIGASIGYLAIAYVLMRNNPGYTADNYVAVIATAFFAEIAAFIGMWMVENGRNEADYKRVAQKSFTEFAKQMKKAIMKAGPWKAVGLPFAIGLFVGLICGALGALLEFLNSDYYREH